MASKRIRLLVHSWFFLKVRGSLGIKETNFERHCFPGTPSYNYTFTDSRRAKIRARGAAPVGTLRAFSGLGSLAFQKGKSNNRTRKSIGKKVFPTKGFLEDFLF